MVYIVPNNWLFERTIYVTTFIFPTPFERDPIRELNDKSNVKISLSPHKVDGIVEFYKLNYKNKSLRVAVKLLKQESM